MFIYSLLWIASRDYEYCLHIDPAIWRMDMVCADAKRLATVAVGINAIATVAVTTVTHQHDQLR